MFPWLHAGSPLSVSLHVLSSLLAPRIVPIATDRKETIFQWEKIKPVQHEFVDIESKSETEALLQKALEYYEAKRTSARLLDKVIGEA